MKRNAFFQQKQAPAGNGVGTLRQQGLRSKIVRSFSRAYDAGIQVTLEYRSETSSAEYEVFRTRDTGFAEYEVVSSRVAVPQPQVPPAAATSEGMSSDAGFFVESFDEERETPGKACCDACAAGGAPHAQQEPTLVTPEKAPVQGVNQQANKMLDALSAMTAHTTDAELEDGFLEDMKTILTDPKSLRKPPEQREPDPPAPVASAETDIFERIARNMQYANQYDFGTLELEKRFEAFDKMADQERPQSGRTIRPPATPVVQGRDGVVSHSDFLEDLDLIAHADVARSSSEPIPLDPGVGGRSIMPSVLQAGDLIISTTADDAISRAIRKATGSEVSHASLYTGNGKVIHATDHGVSEWTLSELLDASTLCVAYHHRDMAPGKAQVVVRFLEEALLQNKGFDHWGLLHAAPSQLMASYCDTMSGARRTACLEQARNIKPGTDRNDQFFCSELVFAALHSAGLSISTVQPSFSSAQEVVRLFHDGTLEYVGHLKV